MALFVNSKLISETSPIRVKAEGTDYRQGGEKYMLSIDEQYNVSKRQQNQDGILLRYLGRLHGNG